jgi:Macro domain
VLQPSEVAHSRGCGALKCRHVIHTVGPIWTSHSDEAMCTELLLRTFQNVMHYANHKLKASTIAIPPIGAGEGPAMTSSNFVLCILRYMRVSIVSIFKICVYFKGLCSFIFIEAYY